MFCPDLCLIVKSNLCKKEKYLACILLVVVEAFICLKAKWFVDTQILSDWIPPERRISDPIGSKLNRTVEENNRKQKMEGIK